MDDIPYTKKQFLEADVTRIYYEYNGGITSEWTTLSDGTRARNVVVRDWQVDWKPTGNTSCGTKLPPKPQPVVSVDELGNDWRDAKVCKVIDGKRINTIPILHGKDVGHKLYAKYGDRTTRGRGISREDMMNEYERQAEEAYNHEQQRKKDWMND